MTKVEAKEATYKETGLEEHWVCEVCEKLFADAEAKTETTLEAVTLPKKTAPITPVGPTKSMADKVEDLIDEIGKVTLDDEEAIDEAREAYEKLTFAQKKQVRNYDELVKAEAALEKLQEEQAAAERVMRFVDVKETDWFYGNVKMAYEKGLIDGTSATNFQPQGLLTVAQTIKLAAALHQMENTGKVTLMNGSDVWYSTYVDYAIANGVIDQSYGDYTDAQMNAAATRSEFVNIFFGAMKAYAVMNSVADNAIPDVKMSDAWADKIYTFYRAGILTGCDAAGTFSPNSNITRGEAATILIRMFDTSARQSITLN